MVNQPAMTTLISESLVKRSDSAKSLDASS